MADFKKALKRILKWEAGYQEDPRDAGNANGGATNRGITLSTYRLVFGNGKTKEDLKCITDDEVETIYRKYYWDVIKGDMIHNQSLAELIFDFVVNSGTGKIKQMQGVTDCIADGKVGPKTLEIWNKLPRKCFDNIWQYRENFYKTIAKKGSNNVFLRGWLARLHDIKFSV